MGKARIPRRVCAAGCGRVCNEPEAIFCSRNCFQHERRFSRYAEFLKGNERPNPQVKSFLRWAVIRYLGLETCSACGWAERHPVTKRIPVEVEHIDGDWKNNHPTNLTLLCPSCHALTPTYRALNWGRGRQTRLGGRSNPLRGTRQSTEGPKARSKKNAAATESSNQLLLLADVA
jgi:hypothetical protein